MPYKRRGANLPDAFARIESVEQVMNIFDYETEEVETIVFAWIKENRRQLSLHEAPATTPPKEKGL